MLCLSKYFLLLSRVLQPRQSTVLGGSCDFWGWAGSWSAYPQQVLSSCANLPWGIRWQKPASWVRHFLRQFSTFLDWSLPFSFFAVTAGPPICITLTLAPSHQPPSRLWWPQGNNAGQLKPWGQLGISLLLSAWVTETTCFNCIL